MSLKTTMKYRFLGNTGVKVSEMCLGTMTFGVDEKWGKRLTEEESIPILDRFAELGGNFIDTSNSYNSGQSEEIVGRWLAKRKRQDFIIATKGRFTPTPDVMNSVGLSRLNLIHSVNDSLKRLQTDYIDLYQIHCWDKATPIEETLSALNDLVHQGKIRYIGVSNVTGWQLQKIAMLCRFNNWSRVVTLQPQYSLLCRQVEYELTDVCKNEGIGVMPWSPLKGGWLTGKIKKEIKPPANSRIAWATDVSKKAESHPTYEKFADDDNVWKLLDLLGEIGKQHGKSVAQVSMKWLLQKDVVSAVIFGAKTVAQLEDNMGTSGDWALTTEQMEALDKASAPESFYPYNFIQAANENRVRVSNCH